MRTPEDDLDRQGSVLAHASALLGLIVPFGLLLLVPNLYAFGMGLRAATEASRGRAFRYPFVFRVLRPVPVTPGSGLGELLDRGEIIPFVVRDLAAARRFYVDQLRLPVVEEAPGRYVMVRAGSTRLCIDLADAEQRALGGGAISEASARA